MADSILEKIAIELVARLQNITTANGYEFDVPFARRIDRDAENWDPSPGAILIDQKEETENEAHFCPGNPPGIGHDVLFLIHGFTERLDIADGDIGVVDRNVAENVMRAAIKKAIANDDAATWHTFDNNAIDARFVRAEEADGPGHDAVTVALLVSYRVSEIDPSVRR